MNRWRAAAVPLVTLFLALPARAHEGDGRPHQHTADGATSVATSASALPRRSTGLPFLVTGTVAVLLGVSMLLRRSDGRGSDGPRRRVARI